MPNVSELIYNHAIRSIAPFASEPGSTWAAVPTGPLTHQAWSLTSIQFRKWLAHSFFAEHGIFPGHQALRHAIHMIQARARFDLQQPKQEVECVIFGRFVRHELIRVMPLPHICTSPVK